MFTWQKGKSDPKLSAAAMGVVEASTFFVGSKNGKTYGPVLVKNIYIGFLLCWSVKYMSGRPDYHLHYVSIQV